METINLLTFLNRSQNLYTLDYSMCNNELINLLELLPKDKQFTRRIDLGIFYINEKSLEQTTIIDGLNRILSLSLLLHAICECYKKTTPQNEKAIKTIRTKYLLNGSKTKLNLPKESQIIYEKIIFGERLSGKEKKSKIFLLLHKLWTQIKEEKLMAIDLFDSIGKIFINIVDTEDVSKRDLYYSLHKDNENLNQLLLIEDYLKTLREQKEWNKLKKVFSDNDLDLIKFFKDFFAAKFNFVDFNAYYLYENFVNYFETMRQYFPNNVLIKKIKMSAILYNEILNVNLTNEKIKTALIQIKMHNGEDTYSYILSIYEDFVEGNISEATFIEILTTIDEYLKNRLKTPNNVSFNELVSYLNAFISCK